MSVSEMVMLILRQMEELLNEAPGKAFFVGGCVRDLLLGRPLHDLDLVVTGDTITLARRTARELHGAFVLLDEENEIARVVLRGHNDGLGINLDFARMRKDDLMIDLSQRDFAVNAMAMTPTAFLVTAERKEPPQEGLIDPHGGQEDLAVSQFRAIAEEAFHSDPLRTLRAVRLSAELDFAIERQTIAWIRRTAHLLPTVSWERIRDEISRLLACPQAAPYLALLQEMALLAQVFPELALGDQESMLPQRWETVCCLEWIQEQIEGRSPSTRRARFWRPAVLDAHPQLEIDLPSLLHLRHYLREHVSTGRPRLVLLKLAAILRLGERPDRRLGQMAYDAARRLRLSSRECYDLQVAVETTIACGPSPGNLPSPLATYRLYRDRGEMATGILLLALAEHLAAGGPTVQVGLWQQKQSCIGQALAQRYEYPSETVDPPRLLDGNDIIQALNLEPGPIIGELLEEIREAQVTGDVRTAEEALSWAHQALGRKDR